MSVRAAIASVDPSTVNVSEFCELHGVSRSSFYRMRSRFLDEGVGGLEPRSRAPKRVANRVSSAIEDQVVRIRKELLDDGFDAGPETIQVHLQRDWGEAAKVPSCSTIWRILTRRGLVTPTARPKHRPRWKRFQADRANECWQADATHWHLADGTIVEIIDVIDDCSRLAVGSRAVTTTNTQAVRLALIDAAMVWGWPERLLTDNGKPFKAIGKWLHGIGITGRHSRPYHPQTCGKVERFHQTLKKHLAKVGPFATINELQQGLDSFTSYYNSTRPHRALHRRTPIEVWTSTPKSGPRDLPAATPTRAYRGVIHDGRLRITNRSITVGACHDSTHVTAIITANNCHIIDDDGTLIRKLTINPNRLSQPLHTRSGRPAHPTT